MLFTKYDVDGEGTLELDEFTSLLRDLDRFASPGAAMRKLMKSPIYWASMLVVTASFCAVLSAMLTAAMGGKKIYTHPNNVLPFAVNRTAWKFMDYPKAFFLLVRATVLFLHQMRFFVADSRRYEAIYEALTRDGELYLAEQQLKERIEVGGIFVTRVTRTLSYYFWGITMMFMLSMIIFMGGRG